MECGDSRPVGVLRYRQEIVDLIENELGPPARDRVPTDPVQNPDEVVERQFIDVDELSVWIDERPEDFTAWFPPAFKFVR